jgi:hypothetical protein
MDREAPVADWRSFKALVKSTYQVSHEREEMLQLIVDTERGRSQVVYLWHRRLMKGTEDWLVIESPFAEVEHVGDSDLLSVLQEAGELACGGIVVVGKFVVVRHAVPLVNLDVNEFSRPLELVTVAADRLEHTLSTEDRY